MCFVTRMHHHPTWLASTMMAAARSREESVVAAVAAAARTPVRADTGVRATTSAEPALPLLLLRLSTTGGSSTGCAGSGCGGWRTAVAAPLETGAGPRGRMTTCLGPSVLRAAHTCVRGGTRKSRQDVGSQSRGFPYAWLHHQKCVQSRLHSRLAFCLRRVYCQAVDALCLSSVSPAVSSMACRVAGAARKCTLRSRPHQ